MAKTDLTVADGAVKKKKQQAAETVGSTLPPSTVPEATIRRVGTDLTAEKTPAEIDGGASSTPSGTAKSASSGAGGGYPPAAPAASASASAAREDTDLSFHMPGEDAEAHANYESALAELSAVEDAAPSYTSRYDAQILDLYEQITSRGSFRYDSATDPLYQQYRQDYVTQGRAAMRDTMGRAAALTGGYGSSYAQSVGQLQFNEYLQRLADILPETYGKALDAWEAEGKELERRYSAATALEQTDYDRYLDELEQYNRTLSNARSDAATAYERMISADKLAYDRAVDDYERRVAADKVAYSRHQDNDSSSSGTVRVVVKKQSSGKDEQSGSTTKKKSASKSVKNKLK